MRSRLYAVAYKGDIKDMFLHVKAIESDRGAQRILYRGRSRDTEPEIFEIASLMFGPTSSPCNAIYVKNANAERFSSDYPRAAASIVNDSYIDDYLSSCKNEQEAAKIIREVIGINASAGFEMHGWASNKTHVLPANSTPSGVACG